MNESDKAQAWKVAWTVLAVLIAGTASVVLAEGQALAIAYGAATTILAGAWIPRPGDAPKDGAR